MTLLDRWEVGLVPFPFTDINAIVKRPALALSAKPFNTATNVTVFAMITKAEFSIWPGDYVIRDWKSAGLLLPSIVRIKCFTLENSLILKRLGKFKPSDVKGFRAAAQPILW